MDYRVNIFLRQRWNDPRLRLPTDFKSEALTVDPNMFQCLWKPDLFFANEKNANFHDVTQDNILLFIFRNGDVLISMRSIHWIIHSITAAGNQCCDDEERGHQPASPVVPVKRQSHQPGYYTCVEVIFTLRRQVGFYMMGVYAPTLLIVVLSWLSFWINPDASAARVPLGILSVLSLSSESMSLASELPKVSYVKAIDIWLIACLLFGFSSLVEYAVVQPIEISGEGADFDRSQIWTDSHENRHRVYSDESAQKLFDGFFSFNFVCMLQPIEINGEGGDFDVMLNSPKRIEEEKAKMATKEKALKEKEGKKPSNKTDNTVVETRCKKVCTSKSDLRSNDFSIVGSLPRDFELSNFDCYGKPVEVTGALKSQNKANKKAPPPKPVIPAAAKRVDLYARALFPFSFLFFNVVYCIRLCQPPPPHRREETTLLQLSALLGCLSCLIGIPEESAARAPTPTAAAVRASQDSASAELESLNDSGMTP
ncbi:Glycine receptor subunit beta [Collichthys lucidus]|uniref:Glycine receptor subunit beta n=1 Tax=Collichthys lucidus TaxID=240159 RepID=A0A4U5U6Y1_COLLU|nr:Glycine receptor subunit beta [Collichthys lucidus]